MGVAVAVAVDVAVAVGVAVGDEVTVADDSVGVRVEVGVKVGACELCLVMRGDNQRAKSSCELPFVSTVRIKKFYPLSAQGTQVDVDGIELAFIDLAPLSKGPHLTIPDLI